MRLSSSKSITISPILKKSLIVYDEVPAALSKGSHSLALEIQN